MVKYSALGSNEVSIFIDDRGREVSLGKPKYGILDWVVLVVVYLIWLVSLPATWWCSVKILAQYERAILFRLGRLQPLRGPGLIFIIPCVDRWVKVDMRMRAFNVPPQEIRTKEGGMLKVGADVQYRITDPLASHSFVQNLDQSLRLTAQSTLNTTLGLKKLIEIENEKSFLSAMIQNSINRTVSSWGVEVARFELTKSTILKDPSGKLTSDGSEEEFQDPMQNVLNILKEFMTSGHEIPAATASSSKDSNFLSPAEIFQMLSGFLTEEIVSEVCAVFQFNISGDGGGTWSLDLRTGNGCVIKGTAPVSPDVTLDMSTSDFQSIIYGQLSPTNAFYSGKIRADGDLSTVLKLDKLIKKIQNSK